jgi:PTB domain (IRS-1 type)
MEVGRFTSTGAGELWLETSDPIIANNMNDIILQ